MKKLLRKIMAVLSVSVLITSANLNASVTLASNDIYEKHYQADLRTLDISLENDTIKISKKDVPLYQKFEQEKNFKVFREQILANKQFEKDLKDMIKAGKTPIGIALAQAEFIKKLDANGNVIESRPMTNKEVALKKKSNVALAIDGPTEVRDTLSLYTSVSGTSPDYWVQANAYWDGGEVSGGREAIGITWESAFGGNNSRSTTIKYSLQADQIASLEDYKPYQGLVWGFEDRSYWDHAVNYLLGAYVGTGVTRVSGGPAGHYFTSEYVHTYDSFTWSAQITFDASKDTKATITLTPSTNTWKLVAPLYGVF